MRISFEAIYSRSIDSYGRIVIPVAAGYEDCNDADYLRIDPAMQLALDKGQQYGASQSVMSRLENDILGTSAGQDALDAMITRSTDVLLKRKNKRRLIMDVDSTEDSAHGNQDQRRQKHLALGQDELSPFPSE